MPSYSCLGQVPHKRHTQFRKPDGSLYAEELFGEEGFSGMYSLLYHQYPPTRVSGIKAVAAGGAARVAAGDAPAPPPQDARSGNRRRSHHRTQADVLQRRLHDRRRAPHRSRWTTTTATPMGDELLFVHEGSGTLETIFGLLPYSEGDYLVIPRGTTWRLQPDESPQRLLSVEAFGGDIVAPKRYRNEYGQLLEHSPYCERDLRRRPSCRSTTSAASSTSTSRSTARCMDYQFDFHPLDLVGWDGYLYPVRLQHPRLRADHRARAPAAAGPSDLRRAELRRLLVLPAQARLPPAVGAGALQSQQHRFRRGDLLRQRQLRQPPRRRGQLRSRCTHAASRMGRILAPSRRASGSRAHRRACGDGRYLPPAQTRCRRRGRWTTPAIPLAGSTSWVNAGCDPLRHGTLGMRAGAIPSPLPAVLSVCFVVNSLPLLWRDAPCLGSSSSSRRRCATASRRRASTTSPKRSSRSPARWPTWASIRWTAASPSPASRSSRRCNSSHAMCATPRSAPSPAAIRRTSTGRGRR